MKRKVKLIVDSGSTKTDWCLMSAQGKMHASTQGISPYFQTGAQIREVLEKELRGSIRRKAAEAEIDYYGTGCANPSNVRIIKKIFSEVFPGAAIQVTHDLMGAARALCGNEKGIACILGTGSNSCYYNGKRIVKNNPGLGFILGDEGSGAYFGKKVLQHYLYHTFESDLSDRFDQQFHSTPHEILDQVYKKPFPNRYLASFASFLMENRGHFMVENILEDGLHDFFYNHIYKYRESWKVPIHFAGTIAWMFRDVLEELCRVYELQFGRILRRPMDGLVLFHRF
ncbi:MAG TPA: BadF/BadG/BcrA/BcrD ATPase family protein [Chitinophagaceae bacterium]|nr:BadF/BadG/BcrA/BcrD ATPase family protein [Chitinophagaceae bacterium]